MDEHPKPPPDENLRFFGKIVASISHEMKNVMAVINEKAGLLKDLSAMWEKGSPLNPARIAGLADDLKLQIKRGDEIIRNMNRFAHSVDVPQCRVNLSDLAGLMSSLSLRAASQKGAVLDYQPGDPNLQVRTRPFLLQNLIWQCLQAAMDTCGSEKSVRIRVESCAAGGRIRISLQDKGMDACGPFPPESAAALLEALRADIAVDENRREIVVTIPTDVNST